MNAISATSYSTESDRQIIGRTLEWMNEFSYKPNVELSARCENEDFVRIYFIMWAPNSMGPEKEVQVVHQNVISIEELRRMDFRDFTYRIRKFIHDMEIHEADEFFKVRGKGVFNPHRAKAFNGWDKLPQF